MATAEFVTFLLLSVAVHWKISGADTKDLLLEVWKYMWASSSGKSPESAKRLDDAMDQLRQNNFVFACRILRHGNFISFAGCPILYGSDPATCAWTMFAFFVTYTVNSCVACKYQQLSIPSLRRLFSFYYFLMFVTIWIPPLQFDALDQALFIWQIVAIVIYVDSAVHIPACLLGSLNAVAHRYTVSSADMGLLQFAPCAGFVCSPGHYDLPCAGTGPLGQGSSEHRR